MLDGWMVGGCLGGVTALCLSGYFSNKYMMKPSGFADESGAIGVVVVTMVASVAGMALGAYAGEKLERLYKRMSGGFK